ncbi:hypothetical protein [Ileibacterium valens]|uniref:Uncharacterized protein n=1 Tax=Ileibacterium valens TaxID=1862668 RepID=A0A1U7NIJ0_9FIRM|nr:hypothetical protein [Ileibacterium valens]OLU36315.1 hypothetical protein BO224_12705 [Erysipelotrichaceae bacterium NYU-BL-E8]OLU37968.1 hypothetical protein BM735_09925 [Erysipelotrichaceae bacterium NYU-BL-F16]OLU42374.1 hypothetical protein BO222_01745 [Ileibacterium valens]
MWKFIEDLKKDIEAGANEIADNIADPQASKEAEQKALHLGKSAVKNNQVLALEDGTVEMINQDQDQIEIYMDNGHGYGIQFPFGPVGYKVEVSPNEKVHKGQVLVTFGPDEDKARVYAFTPDLVRVLSHTHYTIQ